MTHGTNAPPIILQDNRRPQYRDKTERMAVPAMPMPAAVICCILNFLIPGFGTICAGFSAFCCSRNEDIDRSGRCVSCLINWAIGGLQFLLFIFFFIGWFWSCAWGVFFIGMSAEYYHNKRIRPDGGYIDGPPAHQGTAINTPGIVLHQGTVINTHGTVVHQPTHQTTSFTNPPLGPPQHSKEPPPEPNLYPNTADPPPPYRY